jgi:hypothetical protein
VNVPIMNTPIKIVLFFFGNLTLNRRGIGIAIIMISEEMLSTALVIKWFVAAEHCAGVRMSVMIMCFTQKNIHTAPRGDSPIL